MNKQYFNNNQGVGGFEVGGYDRNAIYPTDTNWTRQSRFGLPRIPKVRWSVVVSSAMIDGGNPGFAVDSEGNILVADSDPYNLNGSWGRLWRISKTGEKQIIFETELRLSAPVIGEDGVIYAVGYQTREEVAGNLFCIQSTGEVSWTYKLEKMSVTRPVLDKEGNIYLYTSKEIEGTFVSIKKDGTLNWSKDIIGTINGEPTISEEGIIYLAYSVGKTYLCALNKAGEILWEKQFNEGVMNSSFNINREQEIYAIMNSSLVVCQKDGTIVWEDKEHLPISTPAFDSFGNSYMNVAPFSVLSLTPEGKERWCVDFDCSSNYCITIDKDNNVLQLSGKERKKGDSTFVNAFTMNGKHLWKLDLDGEAVAASIGENQLLYVITNRFTYGGEMDSGVDWILYAIGEEDKEES
ncbi:outer membrane protein assembly factor BamB family protein [Anaerosporobacter sp.]|uniref:outer membrane protein assembly factor BamB family protein n=1 Tax=Anaerosporobacter sp. TaxID=1872529 RepID=UPI00286F1A00|nr:PQQ-binding-like beta-propeller repeat protein [Anaerosporobacter sp.]